MSKSTSRTLGISCIVAAVLLVAAIFSATIIVAVVTIDLVRQPEPITSFARSERNFDDYERELEAVLAQHNFTLQKIDEYDELPDWRLIGISDAIVRGYFVDLGNTSRLEIVFSNSSYFEQIDIAYVGIVSDEGEVLESAYMNLVLELFNSIAQTQSSDEKLTKFRQRLKELFHNHGAFGERKKFLDGASDMMVYCLTVCPDSEHFEEFFQLSGRGFGVQRPIHEWWQW